MIARIISGGQTGADRGGLDAAIEAGLEHGGWCPRDRRAEDGRIPEHYVLRETTSVSYQKRTLLNVRDSDATVIFTFGPLTPGSRLTLKDCVADDKRALHLDLGRTRDAAVAAQAVVRWLAASATPVRVLNVAGSRESKAPGIQALVKAVMLKVLAAQQGGLA